MQGVPAGIAERSKGRVANSSRSKVEIAGMWCSRAIVQRLNLAGVVFHNWSHLVGIIPAGIENDSKSGAGQRGHSRIVEAERKPRLKRGVASDSPSLKDPAQEEAGTKSMRDRDLILVTGHKALTRIEVRVPRVEPREQGVDAPVTKRRAFKA